MIRSRKPRERKKKKEPSIHKSPTMRLNIAVKSKGKASQTFPVGQKPLAPQMSGAVRFQSIWSRSQHGLLHAGLRLMFVLMGSFWFPCFG